MKAGETGLWGCDGRDCHCCWTCCGTQSWDPLCSWPLTSCPKGACLQPLVPIEPSGRAGTTLPRATSAVPGLQPHSFAALEEQSPFSDGSHRSPALAQVPRPEARMGIGGLDYADPAVSSFLGLGVGYGLASPLLDRLSRRAGWFSRRRPGEGCRGADPRPSSQLLRPSVQAAGLPLPPKLRDLATSWRTAGHPVPLGLTWVTEKLLHQGSEPLGVWP